MDWLEGDKLLSAALYVRFEKELVEPCAAMTNEIDIIYDFLWMRMTWVKQSFETWPEANSMKVCYDRKKVLNLRFTFAFKDDIFAT